MTQHWWDLHINEQTFGDYLADLVTNWTGSFAAFTVSVLVVLSWAALGPHFGYSDTWQLVINTGTTIVTFLMVFLIQNNQNRQASRDRIQAHVDFQTTVQAKMEIEALQVAISRIETEKLDWIADQHRDQSTKLIELDQKMDRVLDLVEAKKS